MSYKTGDSVLHATMVFVTLYLDPRSSWTPGPNSTEVFGPPLKFLDPPMCSHFEPWEPLVGLLCRLLGRLSKLVTL